MKKICNYVIAMSLLLSVTAFGASLIEQAVTTNSANTQSPMVDAMGNVIS